MPYRCTNVLFDMLDTNHNGQIEFSEFKAAMLSTTIYLQAEHINKVFQFFDKD